MIKQIHNSLTVHHNSRAFNFDNFSEFQNVISGSQVFKSGPSKIFGRQPSKYFVWSTLEYYVLCISPFHLNMVQSLGP